MQIHTYTHCECDFAEASCSMKVAVSFCKLHLVEYIIHSIESEYFDIWKSNRLFLVFSEVHNFIALIWLKLFEFNECEDVVPKLSIKVDRIVFKLIRLFTPIKDGKRRNSRELFSHVLSTYILDEQWMNVFKFDI